MSTEETTNPLDGLKLDERQALAMLPSMKSMAQGEAFPISDLRQELRVSLDVSDSRVVTIVNSFWDRLGIIEQSSQDGDEVVFTDKGIRAWEEMQKPENRKVDLPSHITDASVRAHALELRNLDGDFNNVEPSKAELGRARKSLTDLVMKWDGIKDSVIAEELLSNLDSILGQSPDSTPVAHISTNEGTAVFIKADEDRIFGFPEKLDYTNSRGRASEHTPIILRRGDSDDERIKKMTSLIRKNRNSMS